MFYLRLERKYKKDLFLVARQLKNIFGFPYKLQTSSRKGWGGEGDDQNAQYKPLENEKQIKYEDQRK